jgi:hypothetical protein
MEQELCSRSIKSAPQGGLRPPRAGLRGPGGKYLTSEPPSGNAGELSGELFPGLASTTFLPLLNLTVNPFFYLLLLAATTVSELCIG